MNNVILIGRLTKDAEAKDINDGKVLSFTLAVNRNYLNKDNERETDFLPVSYWTDYADKLVNYLKKGRLVCVQGSIRVKSYKNQEEKIMYFTEISAKNIQFLGSDRKENVL